MMKFCAWVGRGSGHNRLEFGGDPDPGFFRGFFVCDYYSCRRPRIKRENPRRKSELCRVLFKPPPPVGAGGGYMFSGRPSVPLSVRASVRPSVIHVVVLCFRDISSICWRIFAKLLSLVHLGTEMNWFVFGVKRSKVKVTAWQNTSQIFMFPRYVGYLFLPNFCHWYALAQTWTD